MEQQRKERKKEKTNPGEGFGADKAGVVQKNRTHVVKDIDQILAEAQKALKKQKEKTSKNRCGC